jgi:RNA polymerase sigma-B factor
VPWLHASGVGSHFACGDLSERPRDEATQLLLEAAASDEIDAELAVALRDRVVMLNMSVATQLASSYRGRGVSRKDLDQVLISGSSKRLSGTSSLLTVRFCPSLCPRLAASSRSHFRDHGWAVRPPRPIPESDLLAGIGQIASSQRTGRRNRGIKRQRSKLQGVERAS